MKRTTVTDRKSLNRLLTQAAANTARLPVGGKRPQRCSRRSSASVRRDRKASPRISKNLREVTANRWPRRTRYAHFETFSRWH
jgi:hypothetical protein